MLRIDETTAYSDTYDAFYDRKTGRWLEGKCSDPECIFCLKRPEVYPVIVEEDPAEDTWNK